VAGGDPGVSWPESIAERRDMIVIVGIGVVVSGYVIYAAVGSWLKAWVWHLQRRSTPNAPVYANATLPTGPHVAALGVGAIRATEYAQPVDRLDYTRSTKGARALLSEDATTAEQARGNLPRTLRTLLGGDAELPGVAVALTEEALRQRMAVGPELWTHALDEFATARGLPYGERHILQSLAVDIGRAEDRLRMEGVLGVGEFVPSLLACQWADGVHLVRLALRARWLPKEEGLQYLARAGELTAKWYSTWSTVLAAQLLPSLLGDDEEELAWRLPVARRLLGDGNSPLRVPLPGGFGLAGPR
jgi:uncharacterized protein DUF1266